MGLLLKLQNGDTTLKSLKFGHDRPGGGDSGQPYIKEPIDRIDLPNKDFLLRGGINAPLDAAEDVLRLTKYFFDFRNPSGLLFLAKQNLLSRTSVATEASISPGYGNVPSGPLAWTRAPLNQGIYTPISTLAQAGTGFAGEHVNTFGINPFTPIAGIPQPPGFFTNISLVRYEDVVRGETNLTKRVEVESLKPVKKKFTGSVPAFGPYSRAPKFITVLEPVKEKVRVPIGAYENRLIYLWEKDMITTDNAGGNLLQYSGGPGSVLGIGKTIIKFAKGQRTGINNSLYVSEPDYFYKGGVRLHDYNSTINYSGLLEASVAFGLTDEEIGIDEIGNLTRLYGPHVGQSVLRPGSNYTGQDLTGSYLIGKPYDQIDNTQWKIPVNATLQYNSSSAPDQIQVLADSNNPTYLTPGIAAYQYNFIPSVYTPGTLIPISDIKTYLTKDDLSLNILSRNADIASGSYFSPINQKLTEFGRKLVTDSVYSERGYFEATDPDPNNPVILGRYSSAITLATDARLTGSSDDGSTDSEKPPILNTGAEGYLANLNKNAGTYLDEKGNTIVSFHNPTRVGGRGISVDFRKVNRSVRGFNDNPNGSYDYISTPSDYSTSKTIDRIYYSSGAAKRTSNAINSGNDIIPFRITIVDPRSPSTSFENLSFRAYIDSFSDAYDNNWNSQTYIGRAEKQYKYNSFERNISFGFTIVADSEKNLSTMYAQLNRLAASLAPTYTSQGYMTGNLHRLTLGNYVYEQWGIMNGGFTYEIMDDSPWVIDEGKQLPFYIKVSGVKFTIIHNFRPESHFNNPHQYIYQSNISGKNDVSPKDVNKPFAVLPPEPEKQ